AVCTQHRRRSWTMCPRLCCHATATTEIYSLSLHDALPIYLQWSLLRHADVMQVLLDHETFSSAVSSYPSVPNGMDPPEHGLFRRLIEPYFAPPRMQAFEPLCRAIASELAAALPKAGDVELIDGFAQDFALRIQCAF